MIDLIAWSMSDPETTDLPLILMTNKQMKENMPLSETGQYASCLSVYICMQTSIRSM